MAKPKNVLLIIADQWRADCLGSAGNRVIQTPNLDRLAAEGTHFTSCFNQTAPCGPSRMCIYTGRYMCSTRSAHNCTPLENAEENFGFVLRSAGYDPGLIGYNDYGIDPSILPDSDFRTHSLNYANVLPGIERVLYHEYDSPEYFASLRQKGYPEELLNHRAIHLPNVPAEGPSEHLDSYFPAKYKREDSECRYLTETAIEYVTQRGERGDARGWALSLNYIKPHPPNVCCDPYHRMYMDADFPAAARNPREIETPHPYWQFHWNKLSEPDLTNERHRHEYAAAYYGMISEVDENLGLLFQTLKDSGQWEDTLIVFTSDHGEYLGDHYLTGKGHFYDGSLHIPCLVRDPSPAADGTRGQHLDPLVESVDVAPTILQWTGTEIPDVVQGRSLLPAVRGEPYVEKTEVFHEYDYRQGVLRVDRSADPDKHMAWVVRDRAVKYVQFADPDMPPLLFDLAADPAELENLAARESHTPTVATYCQKLLRWRMYNEDQRMEHWAQQLWFQ